MIYYVIDIYSHLSRPPQGLKCVKLIGKQEIKEKPMNQNSEASRVVVIGIK